VIAAVAPIGAHAQTAASRPKVFSTATDAMAVDYIPDQQGGLLPIQDVFHMRFVTGDSTMSSSNGPTAKASIADPGAGATKGPANACPVIVDNEGQFPDQFKPFFDELQPVFAACLTAQWPFGVSADGFNKDPATAGSVGFGSAGGPLDGEGGAGHAHIGDDGTSTTDATMSGLKLAALPGGGATGLPLPANVLAAITAANGGQPIDATLFRVDSIQSTTANLFDGAATVSHAESRLSGVRLLGGLMTIDSITSVSDVHFTVDGNAVGTSSTTVQGAKVLGQPVTIDDKGVHPDGNPQLSPQQLQDAGLSVKLIGATNGPDSKGFMTAASEGVAIEFTHPIDTGITLPNLPPNPIIQTPPAINGVYFVRVNLASVQSRALARNLTFGTSSPLSSTGSFVPTLSTSPRPSTGAPSGFTGGTATAPAAALTPANDSSTPAAASFLGLNFDLRWLYLAFTLAGFGLCVAPKLVLPARLPASKA
jgi:hypothetical protein